MKFLTAEDGLESKLLGGKCLTYIDTEGDGGFMGKTLKMSE